MKFPVFGLPVAAALSVVFGQAENWPCWRGPRLDGTSNEPRVPTTWSATNNLAWKTELPGLGHASPIVEGNWFLVVSDSGVAHCFDARTGEIAWQERMGEHHASLVSANGLVYFVNDAGRTRVVRPGAAYDVVSQNAIGERVFASPAISQSRLFLRGEHTLFCVSANEL